MAVRFAVLGDIHWIDDAFHTRKRDADVERYAAARRTYYPLLAGEVRAARPDFVVQVGDLLQGGWDQPDQAAEELRQALAWLSSLGCPCYPIRGNHDDRGPSARACDAVLAPYLAGSNIPEREGFSYELTAGGARFVFVDCRESYERPGTREWLRALSHRAKDGERLFVFAHEPLFPVARSRFSDPAFVHALRAALSPCAVDAYFCGHTHNQAIAYHPGCAKNGVLQVKTAVVGVHGADPVPLEQTRALLLPANGRYFGGYLEDTLPSWFLVEADASTVRLIWRRIGGGTLGVLRWDRPAEAEWDTPPVVPPLPAVSDAEIARSRSVRIHMAFHGSRAPGKRVLLNDTPVGDAPPGGAFAPRNYLPLRPEHRSLLRRHNTVALENAPAEPLCWGGVYIEIETPEGRQVRSGCADKVFFTGYPAHDEDSLPAVEHRRPGETLGPVTVSFASETGDPKVSNAR